MVHDRALSGVTGMDRKCRKDQVHQVGEIRKAGSGTSGMGKTKALARQSVSCCRVLTGFNTGRKRVEIEKKEVFS